MKKKKKIYKKNNLVRGLIVKCFCLTMILQTFSLTTPFGKICFATSYCYKSNITKIYTILLFSHKLTVKKKKKYSLNKFIKNL